MRQTDYVILGLLSDSPLTGYQIKRIIDTRFKFFWSESYGQIYPRLKYLQDQRLIEEIDSTVKRNRSQKTYQIRSEGLKALQYWLNQPVARETVRLEILLKMYFSHLISADVMISHIRTFQEAHEKELKTIIDKDPNHPYILKVVNFGEKVNEAYINWSRETIEFLESRKEK